MQRAQQAHALAVARAKEEEAKADAFTTPPGAPTVAAEPSSSSSGGGGGGGGGGAYNPGAGKKFTPKALPAFDPGSITTKPDSPGFSLKTPLLIGGIAVGGFIIYRMLRKK
jgi:hypothetical protein